MGKKILLADDSITIQKVIELTFSDEDLEVVTVGNGRLAIERVQEVRPDLVLCDIIMPEKDGYEVCEFIKKDPGLSHTPVLLLTGAFEPFDQERATRAGCDGFLAKPFEPQTLIAKVKDLLSRTGGAAAAEPAPASQPRAAWEPEPAEAAGASAYAYAGSVAFPEDAFAEPASGGPPASEDDGTVRFDRGPSLEEEPAAAPSAGPEFYAAVDEGEPGGQEFLPVSDEEAETLRESAPPPAGASGAPFVPWSQQTVEVPLEDRAQAGAESAHADREPFFEEAFAEEAMPPPPPAPPEAAGGMEAGRAFPGAAPAPTRVTAAEEADEWPSPPDDSGPSSEAAAPVSVPADMIAQIAQRVVAQISEKVIREIAWEVIPDLAEALIKKEIERLKAELQQT